MLLYNYELSGENIMKNETLDELLKDFNIPCFRRDTTRRTNLEWLNRNINVGNAEHPFLLKARTRIKKELKLLLKKG